MNKSLNLNQKFGKIFLQIIKNDEKKDKILNLIDKLYIEKYFKEEFILCIIKAAILILSYKINYLETFYSILENIFLLDKIMKDDLKEIINSISYSNKYIFPDVLLDKIVFSTIDFLNIFYPSNMKLGINLLYEIILNTKKIKKIDYITRSKFYLKFVKESLKIVESPDNKTSNYYLKIVETCGMTTRLINDWFTN
jgi:hypothetical protein